MTGLQMLLGQLGIKIDPVEIMAEYEKLKLLIPTFAANAETVLKSIDSELKSMNTNLFLIANEQREQRAILEDLARRLPGADGITPAGEGPSCSAEAFVNGFAYDGNGTVEVFKQLPEGKSNA